MTAVGTELSWVSAPEEILTPTRLEYYVRPDWAITNKVKQIQLHSLGSKMEIGGPKAKAVVEDCKDVLSQSMLYIK